MKKTFFLLAIAAAMISCGNNEKAAAENKDAENKNAENNNSATTDTQVVDISANPDYKKGLALIGQNDCLGCHKVADRLNGPSYQEVAQRYAGQPGIEDTLAGKIIKGGSGNWGDIMMTPHPNLSQEDAVAMVKYILLLK